MKKQAKWQCVFIGTEAAVNKEKQNYEGKGYFVQVIPRIAATLDGTASHYGLYVRKVTLKDLAAKVAKVAK